MRQSTTNTVSTRNVSHNDNDFDALLDDLQTTVSRSNSFRGGGGALSENVSGYREVRRTVKDDATGETTTEYQIEYLHPANSTTHVTEYSTSPYYNHAGYGVAGQHNKEISYKYNVSNQSRGDASIMNGSNAILDAPATSGGMVEERRYREERRETKSGSSGYNTGGSATSNYHNTIGSASSGYHNTIGSASSGYNTGARRELVFTGPRSRDTSPSAYQRRQAGSSPAPVTQQVYRYEKTTSTKTIGPDGTVIYESDGNDGGKRSYSEEVRTVRSPSPQHLMYRDPSPGRTADTMKYTVSSDYTMKSNSSSQHESRSTSKTSQPHRSPSPVSFNQPPTPVRSSASRHHTEKYSYDVPVSPTLDQKFSPSDPSRTTVTYNVSSYPPQQQSVTSYKYSTTTTSSTSPYSSQDNAISKPRPFPNISTSTPEQQQPPKKLDELMASLGEVRSHDSVDTRDNRSRIHSVRTETTTTTSSSSGRRNQNEEPNYPRSENHDVPNSKPAVELRKEETKNITGPPVYYPKGELFLKNEESMMQRESAGGGEKYKAKAKYQYESGSKYKESSGTKVVPVCVPCPCCCAAPCSIM